MITIRFHELKERLLKAQKDDSLKEIKTLDSKKKFQSYKEIIIGDSKIENIDPSDLNTIILEFTKDFLLDNVSANFSDDEIIKEIDEFLKNANLDLCNMKETITNPVDFSYVNRELDNELRKEEEKKESNELMVIDDDLIKEQDKITIKYRDLKARFLKAYEHDELTKVSKEDITLEERMKLYSGIILGIEDINEIDINKFLEKMNEIIKDFSFEDCEKQNLRLFLVDIDSEVVQKQIEEFLKSANKDFIENTPKIIEYQKKDEKEKIKVLDEQEDQNKIIIKYSELNDRFIASYESGELNRVYFASTTIEEKLKIYSKIILGQTEKLIDYSRFHKIIRQIIKDFDNNNEKSSKEIQQFLNQAHNDTKKLKNKEVDYQSRTEEDKKEETELFEKSQKRKLNEEKTYLKAMKKFALSFGTGILVGFGVASIVPNPFVSVLGVIRITYSLVKCGNKLISKHVLNGEPTKLDKWVDVKKTCFKEMFPNISKSLEKINLVLQKKEVQWFLNGISTGYVVGNFMNWYDNYTVNKIKNSISSNLVQSDSIPNTDTIDTARPNALKQVLRANNIDLSQPNAIQQVMEPKPLNVKTPNILQSLNNSSVPNYEFLNTNETIDLSSLIQGYKDSYQAIEQSGAMHLKFNLASQNNGTFIKYLRLANGETFTGNIGEFLNTGIDPKTVAARVMNQNGDYAWFNLDEILNAYQNGPIRSRVS